MATSSTPNNNPRFDGRTTLTRAQARVVYDRFAATGHAGGKDADSGYGGPAVTALLELADFADRDGSPLSVLDYGCGQGKLAELVLSSHRTGSIENWRGVDQSPNMVQAFRGRCSHWKDRCTVELLETGNPDDVSIQDQTVDRFISTYCLDLLSEDDLYQVLDLAERSMKPTGKLLLAGITWGYRGGTWQTAVMTAAWEVLYRVRIQTVGGCRPQLLEPYLLARGWRIEKSVTTLPRGFPWMLSEVIAARPPTSQQKERKQSDDA